MPLDAFTARGFSDPLPLLSGPALQAANAAVDDAGPIEAGSRELLDLDWCRQLAAQVRIAFGQLRILPTTHRAVQCSLFQKSDRCNWKVPLHQDLSVPVAARGDHPRLKGWSNKDGRWFVQPPAPLLDDMLAVRLHLEPCDTGDGPLRVVPGSHRHGSLAPAQARSIRDAMGEHLCVARAGDAMAMRPLLLHASSKANSPAGTRRVLHFLFGPPEPGFNLQWSTAI